MNVFDRLQSMRSQRKLLFLEVVGGSRADDRNNGNQIVHIVYVDHPFKRTHGGAFDMMNATRFASCDHLPNLRMIPRLESFQVHLDASGRDHPFCVPHDRKAALRQDVHFDQPDCLHLLHVQVRCGIAFGACEDRCKA